MKQIFIKNIETSNKGFLIQKTEDLVFNNQGPEGAVSEGDKFINVCLAPPNTIGEAQSDLSQDIGLEGKFVVEVDGQIVPFSFNAEDLGKYFNLQDDSGTGVAFIQEVAKSLITCSTGTSFLSSTPAFYTGEWEVTIGGEVIGVFEDGYAIQDYLNEHPEIGVTYQVFPSYGGGSGTPETQGLWTNHNDYGLTLEFKNIAEENYAGNGANWYSIGFNDYVIHHKDEHGNDIGGYHLTACLNKYESIPAAKFRSELAAQQDWVRDATITMHDGSVFTGNLDQYSLSETLYNDYNIVLEINSKGIEEVNGVPTEIFSMYLNNLNTHPVSIKFNGPLVINPDRIEPLDITSSIEGLQTDYKYEIEEDGTLTIFLGAAADYRWMPT